MSTAANLQDLVIAQSPYGVMVPVVDEERMMSVIGGTVLAGAIFSALAGATRISFLEVALVDDGGIFSISSGATALLGLYAPKLTTIGAGSFLDFTGCTALATVSLPRLATIGAGSELTFTDCGWDAAMVNSVLVALDATLGAGTGTINIGGTNASPTGAGSTAKTSLEGKGYTVNI